jgi:hypothetical protein
MSENYVSSDGYKPLPLPERGEDFQEGRQYALTPLARLILKKEYGLSNVPTIVECLLRKVAATRIATHTLNRETGEAKWTVMELAPQDATFRAYLGRTTVLKFTIDVAKLIALEPMYNKSHELPTMEADWFKHRSLQPLHKKLRGCTLRWWEAGSVVPKAPGAPRARATRVIDLSCLD